MVEGGGCSGYQYIFKMEDTINSEEDLIFDNDGSKVLIDKLSLPFLEGAIIDYKDSMIRAAFTISENPKAEVSCSCGSSFAPKLNTKV
jgi:iron-sulfur cluster assembly accessory protein